MESPPPPSLFPPTRPVQIAHRSPHPIPKLAPYPRHEDRRGRGSGHTAPHSPPYTRPSDHGSTVDPPTPPREAHERSPVPDSKSQGRRYSHGPQRHRHPHPPGSGRSMTPHTTGLRGFRTIEHINAQSLQANFDEVKFIVTERNIDILCVSETWLLPHTPDAYTYIYMGVYIGILKPQQHPLTTFKMHSGQSS